jgi:hypothetical protein
VRVLRAFPWLLCLAVAGAVGFTATCGTQPASPSPPTPTFPTAFIYVSGLPPSPGLSLQFDAVAFDTNGGSRVVTNQAVWSSSDPSALTVTATGLATGVQLGVAELTASFDGVSDSMPVSVNPIPCANLTVQPTDPTAPAAGGSIVVTIVMAFATPCAWRVAPREPYVTVSGAASGVGAGSFTLVVAPNALTPRHGYATVIGKLITISQQ